MKKRKMKNEEFQKLVLEGLEILMGELEPFKKGIIYLDKINKALAPANKEFDFKDSVSTPKEKVE